MYNKCILRSNKGFDALKVLHRVKLSIGLLFLAIAFSACSNNAKYQSEFFAMDTVMTITAYGENSSTAVKMCENEINHLDALFSVENPQSQIYNLNIDKGITPENDTVVLLNRACELSKMTDGAFDVTVAPLVTAWGFYSQLENRVPTQSEIDSALSKVGYENIQINDDKITISEYTTLDLGGIAKGYASSKAVQIMQEKGISSAVLSLGGNVRVIGCKPNGTNWTVAVADPDNTALQIGQLSVADTAVVTSGGYQRFFENNGQIYHHIIDTQSGYPADSGLKSVTIVSKDDTLADALSTALFVKGLNKSIEFYKNCNESFEAVFVTDDNKIYITPKLEGVFSSDKTFEVIDI